MEGKLLEGADVKMSCKSSDGSDPVLYKWERLLDKGKYAGKLPPMALLGKLRTAVLICMDTSTSTYWGACMGVVNAHYCAL